MIFFLIMDKWWDMNQGVDYILVPKKEAEKNYAIGSLVFEYQLNNYLYNPEGIIHVGIIVGYINDDSTNKVYISMAHAAYTHVIVSRLRKQEGNMPLHYIVANSNQTDPNLIALIASSLATKGSGETAILQYSNDRLLSMQKKEKAWFHKAKGSIKERYTETMENMLAFSCGDFILGGQQAALYPAIMAKKNESVCNIIQNNPYDYNVAGLQTAVAKSMTLLKGRSRVLDNIAEKHAPAPAWRKLATTGLQFPLQHFSSKGVHCVQFVMLVYQMAFVLQRFGEKYLDHEKVKGFMQNMQYGRRKPKTRQSRWGFEPVHPSEWFLGNKRQKGYERWTTFYLPLTGKHTSPSALLYHLLRIDSPPANGGIGGWRWSWSSVGYDAAVAIFHHTQVLGKHIKKYTRERLQAYGSIISCYMQLLTLQRFFIEKAGFFVVQVERPRWHYSDVSTQRVRVRRPNRGDDEHEPRSKVARTR